MDKERENAAALEALPDLLDEVDKLDGPERLLALIQVGSRVSRTLRVKSFLIRALPWHDALQGCFYVMLCTQSSHLHDDDASMHAALTQSRSPPPPPRDPWRPTSLTGEPRPASTCTRMPRSWRCTDRSEAWVHRNRKHALSCDGVHGSACKTMSCIGTTTQSHAVDARL